MALFTRSVLMDPRFLKRIQIVESDRRGVHVNRVNIEIGGGIVCGAMLAQIIFWNSPTKDRTKDTKLTVLRDGSMWLAKKDSDWWAEIGLTVDQARSARAYLEEIKVIECRRMKYCGVTQTHIRLNSSRYEDLAEEVESRIFSTCPKQQVYSGNTEDNSFGKNRSQLIREKPESTITYSTTEITSETTKTPEPPAAGPRPAGSMIVASPQVTMLTFPGDSLQGSPVIPVPASRPTITDIATRTGGPPPARRKRMSRNQNMLSFKTSTASKKERKAPNTPAETAEVNRLWDLWKKCHTDRKWELGKITPGDRAQMKLVADRYRVAEEPNRAERAIKMLFDGPAVLRWATSKGPPTLPLLAGPKMSVRIIEVLDRTDPYDDRFREINEITDNAERIKALEAFEPEYVAFIEARDRRIAAEKEAKDQAEELQRQKDMEADMTEDELLQLEVENSRRDTEHMRMLGAQYAREREPEID